MISLYVKTHNVTGLRYFGKTTKDPYYYKGSGIYWKKHIAKHGNDVSTIVVGEYLEVSSLLRTHALNFSVLFDIVHSTKWANLINENGVDGNCPGTIFTQETRDKIGKASTGRPSVKKGKSYAEYFGTEKAEAIITKMKTSKYHTSTYTERFTKEKAAELKAAASARMCGALNSNSATWLLTNPDGIVVEVKDLQQHLKSLDLPYGTLKDSAVYKRPVIRGKAKGWQLQRKQNENTTPSTSHKGSYS